jgi:hypothetical protein
MLGVEGEGQMVRRLSALAQFAFGFYPLSIMCRRPGTSQPIKRASCSMRAQSRPKPIKGWPDDSPRKNFVALVAASIVSPAICGISPALAQPNVLEFRGAKICNASAAVALDEQRIMVADDEKSVLSIFDLTQLRWLENVSYGGGEADVEGGTILAGRIVWISSHGPDSKGKLKRERHKLFTSHHINSDGTIVHSPPVVFTHLLDAFLARPARLGDVPLYAHISDSIGAEKDNARLAPKAHGFNIEGLTTTQGLQPAPSPSGLLDWPN